MILLIDTSTETCYLSLINENDRFDYEWHAGRGLADGLLKFIRDKMKGLNAGWNDVNGIGVFEGPGSFTGLRIGLTVMNTVATDRRVPVVGVSGPEWQERAVMRLERGDDDTLVMPKYGRDPNITTPRK